MMNDVIDSMGGIKIVRPAFEAFYGVLDEAQKAHLDAAGPRQWGWHWPLG
jgi:hypothetical protein